MGPFIVGIVIGCVVGGIASAWWRQRVEYERAAPTRRFRHKGTGESWELLCHASAHDNPLARYAVVGALLQEMGGHWRVAREIWPEEAFAAQFEETQRQLSN